MDIFEKERQAKIAEFRQRTSQKLLELLRSSRSIESVANLLGGEDFLTIEMQRGKREPLYHFDVKGFIDDQIAKGSFVRLPESFTLQGDVILPPDEGEILPGNGEGIEEPKQIPRSQALVAILTELNKEYFVIEGTNFPNMMRGQSYRVFVIPELQRMILVNDEEGNATYIVQNIGREEESWKQYLHKRKSELREDNQVSMVIYPGNLQDWKNNILFALFNEPTKTSNEIPESDTKNKYEYAPAGWMQRDEIFAASGRSSSVIEPLLTSYRETHPEWFQKYKNRKNRVVEFFHPDLVEHILINVREKSIVSPPGWKNPGSLKKEMQVDYTVIVRIANKYRESHPEWFQHFRERSGKFIEHYSPELVDTLTRELNERVIAPEGWKNLDSLRKEIQVDRTTVTKISSKYRESHPEWFHMYKAGLGLIVTEHYSPELVDTITRELNERVLAPEGWKNVSNLKELLGVFDSTITKISSKYRESHPEWFQIYVNDFNKPLEFYSPQLVEIIIGEIQKRTLPPEGWQNASLLKKEMKVSFALVAKKANKYRESHPEWFQMYLDNSKKLTEFYSPEFVAQIQLDLGK